MTDFATKNDFRALTDDLRQVETSLRGEIKQVETSLRGEIKQVETSLRGEIKQVETSLRGEIGSLRAEVHILGVRFEQLDSKMTAIAEGLVGFREHYTDEIRKIREELSGRISLLEEVVRQHSADIRKNSEDMSALQAEVANLRRRFDRFEQESELEKRVTEIEKRLGIR